MALRTFSSPSTRSGNSGPVIIPGRAPVTTHSLLLLVLALSFQPSFSIPHGRGVTFKGGVLSFSGGGADTAADSLADDLGKEIQPVVTSSGGVAESSTDKKAEGKQPWAKYKLTEEVTKPINTPKGVSPCVVTLLKDQNFSAFLAPVKVSYKPPSTSRCGASWQLVVLRMFSYVTGRQFDRRFKFHLDDIMLMVATTAQPRPPGTRFSTKRDVTHLQSLFKSPQTGVAELPNIVNVNYTGVFYVTLELRFYKGTPPKGIPDLVLPAPGRRLKIPQNVYQAKVEIFVSHYQSDEFYWFNVPNSYFLSLNPDQRQGLQNGTSFREVIALLDGRPVGAIFHKPLLYSGAINPLFWIDFMGIGSLDMLLYTVDITPFVGILVDGKRHNLEFKVTNSAKDSLWVTEGALLLWTDPKRTRTSGSVTVREFGSLAINEDVSAKGSLTSVLTTTASRLVHFQGTVDSSLGKISTTVRANLTFRNIISLSRGGNSISVDYRAQAIGRVRQSTGTGRNTKQISEEKRNTVLPLQALFDVVPFPDNSYTGYTRLAHGIRSLMELTTPKKNSTEDLFNSQSASVHNMNSNRLFYLQSTSQDYSVNALPDYGCFSRKVKTSTNAGAKNGSIWATVDYDVPSTLCN